MYEKKRVTAMRVGRDTYKEVMKKHSASTITDAQYRSMLVSLKPGCYVETLDGDGGDVVEVQRDHYDIPERVRTVTKISDRDTEEVVEVRYSWIGVEDIWFWEAYDFIAPVYLFEDDNAEFGEIMFESEVT